VDPDAPPLRFEAFTAELLALGEVVEHRERDAGAGGQDTATGVAGRPDPAGS
jgi:hypothetical protein